MLLINWPRKKLKKKRKKKKTREEIVILIQVIHRIRILMTVKTLPIKTITNHHHHQLILIPIQMMKEDPEKIKKINPLKMPEKSEKRH